MAVIFYKWFWQAALAVPLFGYAFFESHPGYIHPFYVSVTEINHNATDKTFEISCKMFTEDFEKTLNQVNNTKVDIYNPKDSVQLDKFIADYIHKHLQIKVDGKPVTLEYIGHEIEDQSTWNYFQVKNINTAPRKVEIVNSILYELFDKQMSIMHVSVGGNRKSTKLDYPATTASFEF